MSVVQLPVVHSRRGTQPAAARFFRRSKLSRVPSWKISDAHHEVLGRRHGNDDAVPGRRSHPRHPRARSHDIPGWTTTVKVENPNEPGNQERLTVQPGGQVTAARSALKRTRTLRRAAPTTGRRVCPSGAAELWNLRPEDTFASHATLPRPLLLLLFATAAATGSSRCM